VVQPARRDANPRRACAIVTVCSRWSKATHAPRSQSRGLISLSTGREARRLCGSKAD